MTTKQSILSKHIKGDSNREITRELHISKNPVNKYVTEYDEMHKQLRDSNPEKWKRYGRQIKYYLLIFPIR